MQIALSSSEERQKLNSILKNNPHISERAVGSIDLVASLYQGYLHLAPSFPFLVVIDSLDEGHGLDDQCRIYRFLRSSTNTISRCAS